jgi:hypothetical protein
VRNIPEEYLSQYQLKKYFERFARMGSNDHSRGSSDEEETENLVGGSDNGGVLESVISLRITNLQKKVKERSSVLTQLEHAINIEQIKGKIPKDLLTGRNKTDQLFEKLNELNTDITNMIEQIEQSQEAEGEKEEMKLIEEYQHQQALANGSFDDEPSLQANDPLDAIPSMSGALSVDSDLTSMTESNKKRKPFFGTSTTIPSTIGEDDMLDVSGVGDSERRRGDSKSNIFSLAGSLVNKTADAVNKTANTAVGATVGVATTVGATAVGAATKTASAATKLFIVEDGVPYSSGFVTFTNLQAANSAQQMIHYEQPFTMEVTEAPAPDDVFWHNVALEHKQLQVGKLISITLTVLLCLFWTIPMSFISSLSSVQGLTEAVPWIGDLLEMAPW